MAFPTLQGQLNGALVLQPGATWTFKRNGVVEQRAIYKSYGFPADPPYPLVTAYPDQNTYSMVCDETKIEQGPGQIWITTVTWIGLWVPQTSYTTYDSKFITVPIEQSPDFINIGGTPDAPQNSAIFDANGQFIGFGPDSQYYGVVNAYIAQDLMIVHGSGTQAAVPRNDLFCESIVNTLRGGIWEYEITYNLDINVTTGLSTTTDVSGG